LQNCNTQTCIGHLVIPPGFTCNSRKTLCYKQTGTGNMHHAIHTCKVMGARVCEHIDMQQMCGEGLNAYSRASSGWYCDHNIASGGNWDDEFGTWNHASCSGTNNDGPAYHSGDHREYVCCKSGDIAGANTANGCASKMRNVMTPNGEICASTLQGQTNMFNAIGNCRNHQGHVCTHNDMMQLAAYGNPWSGSNHGWYGDHGKAPGGNWDDEYGTWNRNKYDANNDGPASHAGSSYHYRCCAMSPTLGGKTRTCPDGFKRFGGICYQDGGHSNMHQAIGHCRARGAHVCEHNEFQEICGHGYNPYYGDGGSRAGWYGDHGTTYWSGGNWDDEYGAWNGGSCSNNNDDPAYHSGENMNFRCCTQASI
jgi:hypothetical protein